MSVERTQLNPAWSMKWTVNRKNCPICKNSGIAESQYNELPCSCDAGKKALFRVAGIDGPVTGDELERHLFNDSPEPLSSAEFNARKKQSR